MKIYSRLDEGKVIYESEKENIKDVVIEARDKRSDLSNSDLSGSNLSNSDLFNSNLRDSDLSNSDLRGSDLSNSDLSGSNLSNSDLFNSNLYHAKFYGRGGSTKIKKAQIESFLKALGMIVEE